jgi:hypothetical protein
MRRRTTETEGRGWDGDEREGSTSVGWTPSTSRVWKEKKG